MGHLHLMINHIPVIGLLFAVPLLAFGMLRNSDDLKLAAVWSFMIIGAVSLVVYFTGDPAEEMLKDLKIPVPESVISPHEMAAGVLLGAVLLTGVIAGYLFWSYEKVKSFNKTVIKVLLAVSIAALLIGGVTAKLGGQIRHTEVRTSNNGGLVQASDPDLEEENETEDTVPEPANL